jgi:hypothetical protein
MNGEMLSEMLVVTLGSDQYPYLAPVFSNAAFLNSCRSFISYLNDKLHFQVGVGGLRDLFGSHNSVVDQDQEITQFIKSNDARKTLLIYYCGHGGFVHKDDYYLTLRCTRPGKEYLTAYRFGDLAETLKRVAADRRIFLILDCCFAGAAVSQFQSAGIGTIIEKKTFDALPTAGAALLVASSKDEPAITPQGNKYTMFTESFVEVLAEGIAGKGSTLSFRDVGNRAADLIRERYGLDGARPEVHCPLQRNADIADDPLFPNVSFLAPRTAFALGDRTDSDFEEEMRKLARRPSRKDLKTSE